MSKDFEYDPETGSFRFDESGGKTKKKNDVDVGGWILDRGAVCLRPVAHRPHRAHLQALGQAEKGEFAAQWHAHEHQSERERYGAQYEQGRKDRCADSEKMNRAPKTSDKTARTLMIIGGIIALAAGSGLISNIGEIIGYGWYSYMAEYMLSKCGFLAGGIAMFAAGQRMKRRSARIARYLAVMGERGYISVEELCTVTGKSRKKIESDLDYMVEKGLLGTGAYLDSGRGIFFRSADAFADYANAAAKKENVTPKEANEGYAGALRAIRSANDRIADPVLSEKIDHLETVAGKIFREVEQHPEKQQQAATFLNYYLPTTLKLLDSYAKFEEAGIEGENLSRAQERIEETMDALIKGFDKQLDDLYRNEAMDIDSDIRVMENMLRRDTASVEDDFGLGGAAVQRAPDEE